MRADLKRLKRETESRRGVPASSGSVAVAQESGSQVTPQPSPASGSSPALAPSPSSSAVKVAEVPVAGRKLWKILVPAAVILVAAGNRRSVLLPLAPDCTPPDREGHHRSRRVHQHHRRSGLRRYAAAGAVGATGAVAVSEACFLTSVWRRRWR